MDIAQLIVHPAEQTAASRVQLVAIATLAFLSVVDLFATQALLPMLAEHYHVMPSQIGLAVNACTFGMAAGGLLIAFNGQYVNKRVGVAAALALLSVPTALLAVAPDIWTFATLRIVQGFLMAAAFGLSLGYLGERYTGATSASVFAAYISGNVASNLIGRLLAATAVEQGGLASNFFVFAGLNIAGAVLALSFMHSFDRGSTPRYGIAAFSVVRELLRQKPLRNAFAIGFCILFSFIGTFTFVNFILVKPPFAVGMMTLGVVYFVFLPSIFTTPPAGIIGVRLGYRNALRLGFGIALLGLVLLVTKSLGLVLLGMTLVAAGTFFAQALATAFVGQMAGENKAAASGLYLASYFTGGLIGTAVLGLVFDTLGWVGCVIGIGAALTVALLLTFRLETHTVASAS